MIGEGWSERMGTYGHAELRSGSNCCERRTFLLMCITFPGAVTN